ncbi:MAG: GxGYxYP domain-containing protein [Cephaloticoccus sp.]
MTLRIFRFPFLALACLLAPLLRASDVPATAYVMQMSDDWRIDGDLPAHALIISLQGLANRDAPRLYLDYGPKWPWQITKPVREFYERKHGIAFTPLATPADALGALARHAKGYVVWDKSVRTSLIVAFTVAGLEDAVIVSEDLIPLAEAHGLKLITDLRGEFTGMDDAQIYQIAYDRYWARCNHALVVWLGGHHGNILEPGMGDWAVRQRAFCTDLSNNPRHPEELALANRIYSELDPNAFVMGWHSYGKDTEGQQVSLTSNHGLRMEGLNTLPNLSFNAQIPFSKGFTFENHHNVDPSNPPKPEPKVYIALAQTDSIGIGAWTKPGRGKLPYTWGVPMSWVDFAPGVLEYFYQGATPNDHFNSFAFPSYAYPKAVPAKHYPALQAEVRRMNRELDLRVMDIMDYSEGNRHVGNTDLTKEVVDLVFAGYPDVLGFTNGYGAARTYAHRDGRALLSYEYYLSPTRPKEEIVADLEELIWLNPKRPYYLLIHVR